MAPVAWYSCGWDAATLPGIDPGRVLVATGRMNLIDGQRVMYNPRYSLRAIAAGE